MAHFVIIGGGIAGLPAANALADAGANAVGDLLAEHGSKPVRVQ